MPVAVHVEVVGGRHRDSQSVQRSVVRLLLLNPGQPDDQLCKCAITDNLIFEETQNQEEISVVLNDYLLLRTTTID